MMVGLVMLVSTNLCLLTATTNKKQLTSGYLESSDGFYEHMTETMLEKVNKFQ